MNDAPSGKPTPDPSMEEIAADQRRYFSELADKIGEGTSLSAMDRELAASALRAFAKSIPEVPKRGPGALPKLNHVDVAMRFVAARVGPKKLSRFAAAVDVAEAFGVSENTVHSCVRKHGEDAYRFFEAMGCERPSS